jgi:hypothetical protein
LPNLTTHPVPVEAMNLNGSIKSGRGLNVFEAFDA